jgi:hypothetical protein
MPATDSLGALDGNGSATSALVTLGGDDLVVVGAEPHSLAGPSIKVRLHVYRAGRTLVLTNRPVLLKGPSAVDRWLVGTLRLSDLVRRAIRSHGALVGGLGGRVVRPEVLNDVVLNERVTSPTIDR